MQSDGVVIANFIKTKKLKSYEVAEKMGVNKNYLSRMLQRDKVTDAFIRKVASAVGVEGSELIKAVREANDEYQIIMNVPGVKDRIGEGAPGSQSMEDILEENARLRKENKELLAKVMQLIDLLDKK